MAKLGNCARCARRDHATMRWLCPYLYSMKSWRVYLRKAGHQTRTGSAIPRGGVSLEPEAPQSRQVQVLFDEPSEAIIPVPFLLGCVQFLRFCSARTFSAASRIARTEPFQHGAGSCGASMMPAVQRLAITSAPASTSASVAISLSYCAAFTAP